MRELVTAAILAAMTGLLVLLAVPRVVALDSAPSGMAAVLANVGSGPVASTNGPVLAFYTGEGRTNARLREAFVNVPADLPPLAADYPTLVVDMQAEVFPGELTDLYARATPRLTVANGNDAWYLADLLEHYGISWGGWDDLLAKWQANRETASQLRVYDLPDLARAGRMKTIFISVQTGMVVRDLLRCGPLERVLQPPRRARRAADARRARPGLRRGVCQRAGRDRAARAVRARRRWCGG